VHTCCKVLFRAVSVLLVRLWCPESGLIISQRQCHVAPSQLLIGFERPSAVIHRAASTGKSYLVLTVSFQAQKLVLMSLLCLCTKLVQATFQC
jgi:hypothetical protein